LDGEAVFIQTTDATVSLWAPDHETNSRQLQDLKSLINLLFSLGALTTEGLPLEEEQGG